MGVCLYDFQASLREINLSTCTGFQHSVNKHLLFPNPEGTTLKGTNFFFKYQPIIILPLHWDLSAFFKFPSASTYKEYYCQIFLLVIFQSISAYFTVIYAGNTKSQVLATPLTFSKFMLKISPGWLKVHAGHKTTCLIIITGKNKNSPHWEIFLPMQL